MVPTPPPTIALEIIAVRLADEGVPLRAIARAVSLPSDTVRTTLHDAQHDGRLLELPKEDWPPGFPRDQRALQLSRMVVEDRAAVTLVLQQALHLTQTEVTLLMLLLQNVNVPKTRINMSPRTIDVHVCRIRHALIPHHISIATLRGYGYQLSVDGRKKLMDMIIPTNAEQAA